MKIALFDLDNTLLPIDSDHSWGEYTQQLGWTEAQVFKEANDRFYQEYQAQTLDIDAYVEFTTRAIRQRGMAAAYAAREQFMREVVLPQVLPQARVLVDGRMAAGYECVLVTATNDFVTSPIAQAFGFKHLIATMLQYNDDGEMTGRYAGVPSFREGKVVRVSEWLQTRGENWDTLEDSVFYSDSINDLPLLMQVRHPFATNPDAELEALAQERGWPVLRLFE